MPEKTNDGLADADSQTSAVRAKAPAGEVNQRFIDLDAEPVFERVKPLLTPPLEITREKLRLLNMMDENVIVHDN